jgi:methionyl-tRNA formyltransferase
MSSISIFFLGGGHGGIAALRSLQSKFGCIEIISSDADARAMARPSDRLCDDLESVTASCGVMAGYLGMLSGAFLAHRTVLNVHYSLLPRYRGFHSIVWAILNMEPEMGLTIHLVNEEMDDGPILYQYQVPYEGETSWELMEQFNKHISAKLGDVLEGVLVGQIHPSQQDKGLATWVPRRNLNSGMRFLMHVLLKLLTSAILVAS